MWLWWGRREFHDDVNLNPRPPAIWLDPQVHRTYVLWYPLGGSDLDQARRRPHDMV